MASYKHKYEVARTQLRELLAVLHRDGGHYTEQVGVQQFVEDAHKVIAAMRTAMSEGRDATEM